MNANVNESTGAFAWLRKTFSIKPGEVGLVVCAFLFAFCVFGSYTILRPVRDAMGITGGYDKIPMLMWCTFGAMLLIQPVFGWIASNFKRTQFVPWVYGFFILNLLGFYLWFRLETDHTLIAKFYFVWVSVYALFVLSVFFSLCADIFSSEQAGRLFGIITGGVSLGGFVGPLIAKSLAVPIGAVNLLLVSAAFLGIAIVVLQYLLGYQKAHGVQAEAKNERPIGGNPFAGIVDVFTNKRLLGIAFFVFMLTEVNTLLYMEQQKQLSKTIAGTDEQVKFLANIDLWVQLSSLIIQTLALSRLTTKLGLSRVILILPILMVLSFSYLAMNPTLWTLVGVILVRRIGEYGLMRPCREMIFTSVPREAKYKAKNAIDTLVYRGGDAITGTAHGWLTTVVGLTSVGIAWIGAVSAAVWASIAWVIARRHDEAVKSGQVRESVPSGH